MSPAKVAANRLARLAAESKRPVYTSTSKGK